MQVPITDAFDADTQLKSVTVRLHSEQLDWLQKKANDLDLSLNHVVRAVVNAHMRRSDVLPDAPEDESASEGSVVDQLRSANARLQEFMRAKESTDADAANPSETPSTETTSTETTDSSPAPAQSEEAQTASSPSSEDASPTGEAAARAEDEGDEESSMTSEALLNQLRDNMRGDGSPDRDSQEPALSAVDDEDGEDDDTKSMFDMVDDEK